MSSVALDREMASIAEGEPIGDHFRAVRRLGAGGMGEVYLAENTALPGIRCAIKVLRSELMQDERSWERLRREADTQSRLKHDNIVQIQDFFRWQDHYCLSMAYVQGQTLADLIEAAPQGLPEALALGLMLDILRGVNHAHEHGVQHCDIKPANVLVDESGRARVTDFGIARDVARGSSDRGMVIGTPEYMSPEQINTPDSVDHRTDVFSAGVVLFEMLTGRLPFPQSDGYPQLSADAPDVRTLRKGISSHLARIVTTALQRDRAARFQGCVEFERAIVRYRWRRTWLPVILGTTVVVLGVGVWTWQAKLAAEREAIEQRVVAEQKARDAEQATAEARQREAAERTASLQRARTAIEGQVTAALTQVGSLCREAVRLEQRQKALVTAREAGFPDLVARFERQVDDIRQNRADYAQSYLRAVRQLGTFDAALVEEILAAQRTGDGATRQLLASVRRDHAAVAAGGQPRAETDLLATCPR